MQRSLPNLPRIAPNKLSAEQSLEVLKNDRNRFWQAASRDPRKSYHNLVEQHERQLDRELEGNKLTQGSPRKKEIALTFDDGPHPVSTRRLLSLLTQYKVPTTFFVVGEMAERYPELVRAQQLAGVDIGNHTYHHVSLTKIPDDYVLSEIKACDTVIQSITRRQARWFRPPGGKYDKGVEETVVALGYSMALWTNDPGDYDKITPEALFDKIVAKLSYGGIILLHDGPEVTIQILPRLIEEIRARGYTFVSLDRLKETAGKPRR